MSSITQITTVPADLIGAQATTPAPQPTPTPSPQTKSASTAAATSSSQPASDPSQRLVISEGAETGVYVYTILDRATGQVMVQIPREEVVKMGSRSSYTAGQVLNTKV
jgi:flagellar protein FlaG